MLKYAIISKNDDLRFNSTSGAVFSEFGHYFINNGWSVCGAAFGLKLDLKHEIVDNIDDFKKLMKSKYLASSTYQIYPRIKVLLDNGGKLFFAGTPCQVAGLKSYLGKTYDNLFTMDFICRGVNSPKAFHSWIKEIEQKRKKSVSNVWFKYKIGGWKTSPMRTRIDFSDSTSEVFTNNKNLYMHGYLMSNLYLRPSCCNCIFKANNHLSDITVGDCWGDCGSFNDDKGTSILILNTQQSCSMFNSIKSNFLYEKLNENFMKSNPMFSESVKRSDKAAKFLNLLSNKPFSKSLKVVRAYPKKSPFKTVLSILIKLRGVFLHE